MWSVLRSKQVCGLKFRRQHPIGPYFADFACVSKKLVVEIDGSSHDLTAATDFARELLIGNYPPSGRVEVPIHRDEGRARQQ